MKSVARGVAATAAFAGLAVGLAAPASAANGMSGHYLMTETNPENSASTTDDWYFDSCGDGCASVAGAPGAEPWGQARLVNGRWILEISSTVDCNDGRHITDAGITHYAWDPNALVGTGEFTYRKQGCFHAAGYQYGTTIQFKQAS